MSMQHNLLGQSAYVLHDVMVKVADYKPYKHIVQNVHVTGVIYFIRKRE